MQNIYSAGVHQKFNTEEVRKLLLCPHRGLDRSGWAARAVNASMPFAQHTMQFDYFIGAVVPEVPVPGSAPDPVPDPPVVSLVLVPVLEPELGVVLLGLPLVP